MRDKYGETLVTVCPVVLTYARNWKAECLGSYSSLDSAWHSEYFWIFLSFDFHIWKMEKLNKVIFSCNTLNSFFRKHTCFLYWTRRWFILWMCLLELYRCLFRCKQENCLWCSSPHSSLRLKECIFFSMFSFQKTRWRKSANFCPHNLQVTSMEQSTHISRQVLAHYVRVLFFFFPF